MALDQFRRDEVEIVLRHGGHRRPALPVVQPFGARLAHAAGDDDVRIGGDDALDGDRRRQDRQGGENVLAAAEADGVADDLLAVDGHQRLLPYLVEDPQLRPRRIAGGKLRVACAEGGGGGIGDGFGAGQTTVGLQGGGDILDTVRLRQVDRQPQRAQLGDGGGQVAALPADDEVGLERRHGFEIDLRIAADARQRLGGGGPVAVFDGADDALARAGGEQHLGHVRRQADDALRRTLQAQLGAAVVAQHHVGPRRKCRQQRARRQYRRMPFFHVRHCRRFR